MKYTKRRLGNARYAKKPWRLVITLQKNTKELSFAVYPTKLICSLSLWIASIGVIQNSSPKHSRKSGHHATQTCASPNSLARNTFRFSTDTDNGFCGCLLVSKPFFSRYANDSHIVCV